MPSSTAGITVTGIEHTERRGDDLPRHLAHARSTAREVRRTEVGQAELLVRGMSLRQEVDARRDHLHQVAELSGFRPYFFVSHPPPVST